MQYIPDIFSDPCLDTLLLVEDESLVSCGSYRAKTLSSQGRSLAEVILLLGKKIEPGDLWRIWLTLFENLSAS